MYSISWVCLLVPYLSMSVCLSEAVITYTNSLLVAKGHLELKTMYIEIMKLLLASRIVISWRQNTTISKVTQDTVQFLD